VFCDRDARARDDEGRAPTAEARNEIGAGERQRAGNPDARRVPSGGAGHELALNAICQELEAGHIRSGPTCPGQRPGGHGRPESVGKETKQQVPRNGHRDADEVDELGVDPVSECDQHGHG